jgi:beta-lactamase regulating signal transducer with metallopeptidase domain
MSDLAVAWSVTYLVHSTLFVVLTALVTRAVRSASARDTLWKVALLGGIVTASLQLAVPFQRLLPQSVPQRMTMTMPAALPQPAVASSDLATPVATAPPPPARLLDVTLFGGAAWLLISLLLLARIALGRARFLAAIAGRVEILGGDVRVLVDGMTPAGAGPVRLTESHAVRSPIAMLGREVVIPAGLFAELTADQRETILAHELAHLERRDPLWLTVAEGVKALFFFQPLNWLVQMKMKETAELLCDDAAVLRTGNGLALAETLAALAASVAPSVPAVAAMAEGGSNLVARVARVLSAARPGRALRPLERAAIGAFALLLMVLFGPAVVPSLSTAAIASPHSSEAGAKDVNHVEDATLSHSWDGPEGQTHLSVVGHHATIVPDGSSIRFDDREGYVTIHYVSARGPRRDIDVRAGRDGSVVRRYEVGGREQEWSSEAEQLIAAAFTTNGGKSVSFNGGEHRAAEPRTRTHTETHTSTSHASTWNATVGYTGTRDGVAIDVTIDAVDVGYDAGSRTIDFSRASSLVVRETVGGELRELRRTAAGAEWGGVLASASREERMSWLRGILSREKSASPALIDALTR